MLFKPLLAFAATAAAILVVPEVSQNEEGVFRALPVDAGNTPTIPVDAFAQSIDVPCIKCRGRNAHLKLDFAVEDASRLVVNGFQLYPSPDTWNGELSATVVRGHGHAKEKQLGYSLAVVPEGIDEEAGLGVVGIYLRIIQVGGRFVKGIPEVGVKIIRAPSGEMVIGSINVEKLKKVNPEPCTTMWCRVSTAASEVLHKLKGGLKGGCHGKHHGGKGRHGKHHGKPELEEGAGDKHHGGKHHGKPEWMKHDGPHSQQHDDLKFDRPNRHTWGNMLMHMNSHILLPVILGLTAGVAVALVAMAVGTFTVRLVRLFKGERPQCPFAARKATIIEVVPVDSEKAGLMAYQDVPPYEEEAEDKESSV